MENTVMGLRCTDSLRMKVEVLARSERRLLEDQIIHLIDEGMRAVETMGLPAQGEPRIGKTPAKPVFLDVCKRDKHS